MVHPEVLHQNALGRATHVPLVDGDVRAVIARPIHAVVVPEGAVLDPSKALLQECFVDTDQLEARHACLVDLPAASRYPGFGVTHLPVLLTRRLASTHWPRLTSLGLPVVVGANSDVNKPWAGFRPRVCSFHDGFYLTAVRSSGPSKRCHFLRMSCKWLCARCEFDLFCYARVLTQHACNYYHVVYECKASDNNRRPLSRRASRAVEDRSRGAGSVHQLSGGEGRGGVSSPPATGRGIQPHSRELAHSKGWSFQPDFVDASNQHAEVVCDDLAQNLVHLTDFGLGANRVPKLALDHGEHGLDVRPLVVVGQEGVSLVGEKVLHLVEDAHGAWQGRLNGSKGRDVAAEGDVGRSACVLNRLHVLLGAVRLVGGYVPNVEVLNRCGKGGTEVERVIAVGTRQLYGGHDVGTHSRHGVELHPLLPDPLFAPLVVVPAHEPAGAESSGVHREVGLNLFQRECRNLNKLPQSGRHFGRAQVTQDGVEMRVGFGQTVRLVLANVGVETPSGQSRVDAMDRGEGHIAHGHPRAPLPLRGVLNERTEVAEHWQETLFLFGLSGVVGRPVLGVGHAHGLGQNGAVRVLTLADDLDGEDVLAGPAAGLKVRAGATQAERFGDVLAHVVGAQPTLRGDRPAVALGVAQTLFGCDFQTPEFSCVHLPVPPSISLIGIYTGCTLKSIPRRYIVETDNRDSYMGGNGEGPGLGLEMRAVRPRLDAARGLSGRGAAGVPEMQIPLLGQAPQAEKDLGCKRRAGDQGRTGATGVKARGADRYTTPAWRDGSGRVGPQTWPPRIRSEGLFVESVTSFRRADPVGFVRVGDVVAGYVLDDVRLVRVCDQPFKGCPNSIGRVVRIRKPATLSQLAHALANPQLFVRVFLKNEMHGFSSARPALLLALGGRLIGSVQGLHGGGVQAG